jgi:hypothetical protein
MADQVSLRDFLRKTLADMSDTGAVSGEEFFGNFAVYEEARAYLENRPEIASQLLLLEGEEAKEFITRLCSNPGELLNLTPATAQEAVTQTRQAESVLAGRFPTEDDTRFEQTRGKNTKSALTKHYANQFARMEPKVSNFVTELRNRRLYGSPQEEQAIQKELQKPVFSTSLEEIHAETKRRILSKLAQADKVEAARAIDEALSQNGLDQDLSTASRIAQEATQTIIKNADVINADIVVEAISTGRNADQAAGLARMASVVDQVRATKEGIGSIGTTVGKSANDIIATVAGVPEGNIPTAFAAVWEKATATTDHFAQRLGSEVVNTPSFNKFIHTYEPKSQGGSLRGLFSGPRVSQQDAEDYAEVLWRTDPNATPDPQEFFLSLSHKNHPEHFHFELELGESPLDWILKWGAKKEGKAALATGSKGALQGAAVKFLGKFLPARLAFLLGGWVGTALFVVVSAWDFLKKGFRGIIGAMGSGGFGAWNTVSKGIAEYAKAITGATYNDPFLSNYFLGGATLIVACILVIPFWFTFLTRNVWNASLIGGTGGGGGGHGAPVVTCDPATDPTCIPQFCDPAKQSCAWPVPCGCVTSLAGHSGGLNGIDIGTAGCADEHQPVQAVCSGTISIRFMHLGDGEKCFDFTSPACGFGYGNTIDLLCDDGKTQFRYAHLLKPGEAITDGAHVDQGRIIAYTNNNGNSTGPHLHFEYCAVGKCGTSSSGSLPVDSVLPVKPTLGYCIQ